MKQWGGDQNYRPEKKRDDSKKARRHESRRALRAAAKENAVAADSSARSDSDSIKNYRVGKTIAGSKNPARQRNLEHIAARKKQTRRNVAIYLFAFAAMVAVVIALVNAVKEMDFRRQEEIVAANPVEPTVPIVDENVGNNISERVKVFVARLEADAKDYGLKVDHIVLPFQKAREILVYFEGRGEYYKMSIERGSTVQAEDAERMIRYLQGKGIQPEYVDLRVEGKAYYK